MNPPKYYHRERPDENAPRQAADARPSIDLVHAPKPPDPPRPNPHASLGTRLAAPTPPPPPPQRNPALEEAPRLTESPRPKFRPVHWAIFAAIIVAALWLRLRDPLTSSVIGAEDPYLHMERTWDFLAGSGASGYPIGLMIFLAPFAMLGPDVFYTVVRFLPAFLGAGGVAAMFFLCRPHMHPMGTLTTSLVVAVLPEHIRRTNLMFATAIDLAVLPILVLAVMAALDGKKWGWRTAGALAFALLFVSPWVVVLVLPPLAFYGLLQMMAHARTRRLAVRVAGGSAALFVGTLFVLPASSGLRHVFPKLFDLFQNPTLLLSPPPYVDLDWMLTVPVLVLGAVGFGLAFVRRTKLHKLALIWVAFMLPLVLVDWFGTSDLPHRIVVYMSLGLAILVALPVVEVINLLEASPHKAGKPAAFGVLGLVFVVALPSAMALPAWYRVYDDQDLDAWHSIADQDADIVMAGSWQSRVGFRAVTGETALYNPDFFRDQRMRDWEMEKYDSMVVIVDEHTAEEGLPTSFLEDWNLIGEWGATRAYERA